MNDTVTSNSSGVWSRWFVVHFCLDDGIHTLKLTSASDTSIEAVCFEFDDADGENFNGCGETEEVFHTAGGNLFGAPSSAPTVSHSPSIVPTSMPQPQPTALPTPLPTYAPTAVPSYVPSPAPTASPTLFPTLDCPSDEFLYKLIMTDESGDGWAN